MWILWDRKCEYGVFQITHTKKFLTNHLSSTCDLTRFLAFVIWKTPYSHFLLTVFSHFILAKFQESNAMLRKWCLMGIGICLLTISTSILTLFGRKGFKSVRIEVGIIRRHIPIPIRQYFLGNTFDSCNFQPKIPQMLQVHRPKLSAQVLKFELLMKKGFSGRP